MNTVTVAVTVISALGIAAAAIATVVHTEKAELYPPSPPFSMAKLFYEKVIGADVITVTSVEHLVLDTVL